MTFFGKAHCRDPLDSLPTAQELAEFRIYWMAEGKAYHQVQWEQKLARRLQINSRQKQSTLPDNNVPHWNSPGSMGGFGMNNVLPRYKNRDEKPFSHVRL